jgi:dihydrofolate reductase
VQPLIYSAITSLDGFVADQEGTFDWAAPDDEVHQFVNDLERPVGTYLYGRRLYDVMAFWEDPGLLSDPEPVMRDYAQIWQAADKVVFSRTLGSVRTARTRLERDFDPEAVRRLKAEARGPVSVGGPELAAAAIRAGLVDEWHQLVTPVLVGGGRHWLPRDVRLDLELVGQRRFAGGVVHLAYRTRR